MFIVNTATSFGGISLQHENLQGTLASKITADKVIYQDDSTEITLNNLDTGLSLFWLLDATLAFDDTKIGNIAVTLKENGDKKSTQATTGLPIGLSFSSLSIDKISITREKPVFEITELLASEIAIRKQIDFDELQFVTVNTKFSLDGSLGFAKTSDIDLEVNWDVAAMENVPAISGRSAITGNLTKLSVDTDLDKPQAAHLKTQIENIFDDLKWHSTVSSESIDLGVINTAIQTKLQRVNAEIHGDLKSATVEGTSVIADPQFGQWDSRINATFTDQLWKIPELLLLSPKTDTRIQIQAQSTGTEPYAVNSEFKATMAWQNLQWPVNGQPDYRSEQGKTQISGTLEDYSIKVNGHFAFDDYRFNDIEAEGRGTTHNLQFDSFIATYLQGNWQGSTSLDWQQGFQWQAALNVKGANPAVQWPSLAGKLDATVTGKGKHGTDDWLITGDIKNLSGSFRNYPVHGNSQYSVSAKEYAFPGLDLRSGVNTLKGAIAVSDYLGDADTQIKANWKLRAKNLAQLIPDASGSLTTSGKIYGSLKAPVIDAVASSEKLKYLTYDISRADLAANLNLQRNDKISVNLDTSDATVNNTVIKKLKLNISGSTHSHDLTVTTTLADKESAQLLAKGGYKDGQWDGKLTALDINTDKFGTWQLSQPFTLRVSESSMVLKNACTIQKPLLTQGTPPTQQARICVNVDSQAYTSYKVDSEIFRLPLDLVRNFLPGGITHISGTVDGNAHLFIDNQVIKTLKLSLQNEGGDLTHTLVNETPRIIKFEHLSINASHSRQAIILSSKLDLQDTGHAKASLSLNNVTSLADMNANQSIAGDINIDINDLSLLPAFFPDIQSIEGKTSSIFHVSGTLGNPRLTGESKLVAPRIVLPLAGLELKNTELYTRSSSSRKISIEGKSQSGDGFINIKGELPDYAADHLMVKLDISGKNFLAAKIPDVEMHISPKLLLMLDDNTVHMDGEVYVDKANISPMETYNGLTPSSDVVFIDPHSQSTEQESFKMSGAIRLKLSDQVYVQSSGFVGRITGELLINESSSDVTLATGELLIKDGRYTANVKSDNIPSLLISIAQKELLIDDSKLIFASSPIDNPRLDIHARRPTGTDIVVGVDIKGNANNPQIVLYSEPAMDQADILAYLTLGYPLAEASKNDGQYLARIASSIGLVGGEKLAKGIAKEFGIDEVYIQSQDTTQQAQLVLGKYLSPKLYVRYAVGIGEAVDTLQIQYKLTDKLILRTETAESQTGTDIIYTIEKD